MSTRAKTKSTSQEVLFVLERCVPPRRNEMCPSGVMFPLEVMCASRVSKEHITSLCAKGAIHHYGEAITSLRQRRNITKKFSLVLPAILWYNKNRKAASPPSTRRRRTKNEKIVIVFTYIYPSVKHDRL